jgi:hypothetical protein
MARVLVRSMATRGPQEGTNEPSVSADEADALVSVYKQYSTVYQYDMYDNAFQMRWPAREASAF